MRKGLMLTSVAGALSMVFGGVALAATHTPPIGGWSVGSVGGQAGTVGTPGYCSDAASAFSCSVVASGPGFLQLQVGVKADKTTPGLKSGEYFIQTIVTDQNADGVSGTLGFQDVSFIKMSLSLGGQQNVTQNGIYGEQSIIENKTGLPNNATEKFESSTTVASGWGNITGTPSVIITQGIKNEGGDTTTQSDDFVSGFDYKATVDQATGIRNGLSMDISQTAGLAAPKGTKGDIQAFALRERQGTFNPAASTAGLKVDPNATVTWAAKDDIKAIWIGQNVDLSTNLGGAAGGSVGSVALGSSFGYLSFENLSAPAASANRLTAGFGFDKTNADKAWQWDAAFGAKPTVCSPDGLQQTCTGIP